MNNRIETVFHLASQAILDFCDDENGFSTIKAAAELISVTRGPLLVSGIGKSGYVAQKTASTFRSLGRDAHFIHAAEASHGDLGCFVDGAILLVFSNSGETSELSDIVHFFRDRNHPIIAITESKNSTIGRASSLVIAYGKIEEADKNGLAPTTSTTLSTIIGDAIALAYAEEKNFQARDFAHFHPRGRLGARLQIAGEIMRKGEALPILPPSADIQTTLLEMSHKRLGLALFMEENKLIGVLTDGDLRRNFSKINEIQPIEMATRKPITADIGTFIGDAVKKMSDLGVTQLIITENGNFAGVLHMHDCVKA